MSISQPNTGAPDAVPSMQAIYFAASMPVDQSQYRTTLSLDPPPPILRNACAIPLSLYPIHEAVRCHFRTAAVLLRGVPCQYSVL